jgi:hypothetical protein
LPDQLGAGAPEEDPLAAPVSLDRLAAWLDEEQNAARPVVKALVQTHGTRAVVALVSRLQRPGVVCLALAEEIAAGSPSDGSGSVSRWAVKAAGHGVPAGTVHRLLALGVALEELVDGDEAAARERLLVLTRDVRESRIQSRAQRVAEWLDAIAVAARRDLIGLNTVEALVAGSGWYLCWLRFTVALVRAEAAEPVDRPQLARQALDLLTEDLDPFAGNPRSCDLYSLSGTIDVTIRRAVALLDDEAWSSGLELLATVSRAITTTLGGELGGPLPPDQLLRIAVDTATPTRSSGAAALVRAELEAGSGGRYYSDLAMYRLLGARLALAVDDPSQGKLLWTDACRFMTAYGSHKDITLYELLDPLSTLIAADPARGRSRVGQVQPLCERVLLHTDGKETRSAWRRWWQLLAAADPAALARLAAPALLGDCNSPRTLLHDARYHLWKRWHEVADPAVAAALRLTLDSPLDAADAPALARLAELRDPTIDDRLASLLRWLLSRADERPYKYTDSNGTELLAADNENVASLNVVAETAGAPRIAPLPTLESSKDSDRWRRAPSRPALSDLKERLDREILPPLPTGSVGLARTVRAWLTRTYRDPSPAWALDRMANVIGYRMCELTASGCHDEVAAALRSLAAPGGLDDGHRLLATLAEGLDRHGLPALAAEAYALTWTRARGGGGWLAFGGETSLDALRRASQLDPAQTLRIVAEEA